MDNFEEFALLRVHRRCFQGMYPKERRIKVPVAVAMAEKIASLGRDGAFAFWVRMIPFFDIKPVSWNVGLG